MNPVVRPAFDDVTSVVFDNVSSVLKQPVKAEDNLLELGVDSLVGTVIVVGIRSALNSEIPLQLLFENPVLGDFRTAVWELTQEPEG